MYCDKRLSDRCRVGNKVSERPFMLGSMPQVAVVSHSIVPYGCVD